MTARDDILSRVRAQRAPTPSPVREYRARGSLSQAERVDLFCARVAEYRARVIRIEPHEARDAIADVAAGRHVVVAPGFPTELRPEPVIVDDSLTRSELAAIDVSLTGATAAIAETGTLILTGSQLEGRRAMTLIPDAHICLVYANQIVETVPEGLQAIGAHATSGRPLTLISGPSATSDIELQRVEGVHGPRELTVIVCDGPVAS
jgi:L-lactate dehydrogenase complex protein LldG